MLTSDFPFVALNIAAALFILARYLRHGLVDENNKPWLQALAVPGAVAVILGSTLLRGFLMSGVAGSYLDGASTVLGFLLLGLAVSIWRGWSLLPFGVYAILAGVVAFLAGVHILGPDGDFPSGLGLIFAAFGCFLTPGVMQARNSIDQSDAAENAPERRTIRNNRIAAGLFYVSAFFWLLAGLRAILEATSHMQSLTIHLPPLG